MRYGPSKPYKGKPGPETIVTKPGINEERAGKRFAVFNQV
jgi:hypothetical protein